MAVSTAEIGGGYKNIAAGATTLIAKQSCVLNRITVNNPGTTITATVYDGINASAPVIATILLVARDYVFNLQTLNGLTVVTSGTCDITVITG